jgi:mannosyltransferase OCH1-like enzyme
MIPHVFHQFWTGSELPVEYADMIATWKTHHPDWKHRFWTADNMIPLLNQKLYDRADQISPHAPEQFQSDVVRYEILYRYGGVWADVDFVCQKPIDDLMGVPIFAGRVSNVLNNALIGAPEGHAMLFDLIAKLPANVARYGPSVGNTVKSGPQFFTPIARRHKITEYPARYFYPYTWEQLDSKLEGEYATHRWNNARRLASKR